MKKTYVTTLLISTAFFMQLGCSKIEDKQVKLRTKYIDNGIFKITVFKDLEQVTLAESKLDSSGWGDLKFEIEKPTLAYIQIDNNYGELYLTPGDDLVINLVKNDSRLFSYNGRGAEANNYIDFAFLASEKIKMANNKPISLLDSIDFFKRYDSLKNFFIDFHKRYTDSVQLKEDLSRFLKEKTALKLLTIRQEYAFMVQNNALNEARVALQVGKPINNGWPSKFNKIADEVPFQMQYIENGSFDYSTLLQLYLYNAVYINNADPKTFKTKDNFVQLDHNIIKQRVSSIEIREYLEAKNIQYWLQVQGINSATDSIYNEFKTEFSKSNYLPALDKIYKEWLALSKGKKAPHFVGETIDKSKFELSDLKGKLVYIDVWATWCGPCVEEIPFAKKLQERFEPNHNIKFLNVSIDNDLAAWRAKVKAEKNWKGIHININGENADIFWRNYKIGGVPKYMLIDNNGDIIDVNASRPSDAKLERQISELLGNTKRFPVQ
jgi:thiol-disulfide isomerase/thioredoxin